MHTPRVALAALLGLVPLATACGDDDDDTETVATTTTAEAAAEPLTITGAWARTTPAGTDRSAAYLTITSAEDDALVQASVDPSVAGSVELHETVAVEGDGMSTTTMAMGDGMSTTTMVMGGGEMTMRPVDRIDLPAGEPVSLQPGGYHIMLFELAQPLAAGDSFELTLTFESAGDRTIDVTVSDEAP